MRYVLMLNDMRSPNIENLEAVKVGTRQELIDYHNGLLVEPYRDGQWSKRFAKGSELEWFNPSSNLSVDGDYFGGIYGPVPDDVTDEALLQARLSKW